MTNKKTNPKLKATVTYKGKTFPIRSILLNNEGKIILINTAPEKAFGPYWTFEDKDMQYVKIDLEVIE